jgi:putative transposase
MSHEDRAPAAPARDRSAPSSPTPESGAATEAGRPPPSLCCGASSHAHPPCAEGSGALSASTQDAGIPPRLRWARLRFAIIGPLLASPPGPGELAERVAELARRPWKHPTTGEARHFSAKTIERLYYIARNDNDPLRALERKVSRRAGTHPAVSAALVAAIEKQYSQHARWSYQLHHDNLVALRKEDPTLGAVPGYATVRRYMKDRGFYPQRQRRGKGSPDEAVPRETRSFEMAHVHALWHFDFHVGKRQVLTATGEWKTPYLLGVLDDRSRMCCHAQWYLRQENTEDLIHGLCQAFQKRKLPRAFLDDNGSPMKAAELLEGLERLGIVQFRTQSRSPKQNGKQEHFWTRVEGRLMAMLEGEPELTLELLNRATQAWVEMEYHREIHSELGKTPLERYLEGPDVGRPSPGSDALRRAFRMEVTRTQRRSDGTVTVEGVRFEVPSAYRTLLRLRLRVARWDLSSVDLVDPRTGMLLTTLLPLDKTKNADRARRVLAGVVAPPAPSAKPPGLAPLMRQLMADYAATGLPPAYLPKDDTAAPAEED